VNQLVDDILSQILLKEMKDRMFPRRALSKIQSVTVIQQQNRSEAE